MKIPFYLFAFFLFACASPPKQEIAEVRVEPVTAFSPPVDIDLALEQADSILEVMSVEEKIQLVGGHNFFFIKGYEKYGLPQLYLSDATQGVHIREDLSDQMEKSTAFPCPILLAATWNPGLAYDFANCIGEQCRAGDIGVLLGPGMNIYRISQNGRNFEYFGEDPFLTARMIEQYVVGMQNTGTISTLKHFICNNHEFHRRKANVVVDERALHEIYMPAFKAGIDAGAMAVMTSYNLVKGEWAGQSDYVIKDLLRDRLGFKGLVMSDWWSVWEPEKVIKSGLSLDMPGSTIEGFEKLEEVGDVYIRTNAPRLIEEGKIKEEDLNQMARYIIGAEIAMGLTQRPVKDEAFFERFPEHEKIALKTAKEGIVLLKNSDNCLPLNVDSLNDILVTGSFANELPRGLGSAEVEGYDQIVLMEGLKNEFGDRVAFVAEPTPEQLEKADAVIVSIGTIDSEGWDQSFELSEEDNQKVLDCAAHSNRVVVVVNSGGGRQMAQWNDKVEGIVYAWYVGQNGNIALAEILSGKTNPSGKLPISIEKNFADSPGADYLPEGEALYTGWDMDMDMSHPIIDVPYDEGVLVGYRWYEKSAIEPLYAFGHGLSYADFNYDQLKLSDQTMTGIDSLRVECLLTNSSQLEGTEVVQLYLADVAASVERPVKELKRFVRVNLLAGDTKKVVFHINKKDLSFWDVDTKDWKAEDGQFKVFVGSASNDIRLIETFEFTN